MNFEEYIHAKENQRLEFKSAKNGLPASIYETYCSFANTLGGTIVLGIKEGEGENEITGVTHPKALQKDFFNTISNKTKVSVCLLSDEYWKEKEIDGKTIVEIRIPEAPREIKPVYLNGNPILSYIRRNDGDYLASESERKSMELDSFSSKSDMKGNPLDLTFDDLNKETLEKYRTLFNTVNSNNYFASLSDVDFYKSIGVLLKKDGDYVVSNAGVLMFGSYVQIKQIYPGFDLDYRENLSNSSRWDYRLDASSLSWSGNVFDFLLMSVQRMRTFLPNPFHLSVDGINEDGGKLVLECAREGICNALSNCDFLLSGGVSILVESNKVTIKNAGRMHLPMELALLGGDSDPRNVGLMNLLHLVKIGDKAGTGIPNIILKMEELSYPRPIWEEKAFPSKVVLTLLFTRLSKSSKKDRGLDENIISYLSKNGSKGVKDIGKAINKNNAQVSIALKGLKERNIVGDNGKATKGKRFFLL